MSQVNRRDATFRSLASQSSPIAKLPAEVLMRIFRIYVESYPEVLNERVVDLCLVGKYWNAVANDTPQLWTNVNFRFPFDDDHLATAHKRVRVSKLQTIDVLIDCDDPDFDQDDVQQVYRQSAWIESVMTVLKGTESRSRHWSRLRWRGMIMGCLAWMVSRSSPLRIADR